MSALGRQGARGYVALARTWSCVLRIRSSSWLEAACIVALVSCLWVVWARTTTMCPPWMPLDPPPTATTSPLRPHPCRLTQRPHRSPTEQASKSPAAHCPRLMFVLSRASRSTNQALTHIASRSTQPNPSTTDMYTLANKYNWHIHVPSTCVGERIHVALCIAPTPHPLHHPTHTTRLGAADNRATERATHKSTRRSIGHQY